FPTHAQPWPANARGTRVAGINSFGMGGSSAFVVVESHAPALPQPAAGGQPAIVVLSSRSTQALHAYLQSVCRHMVHSAPTAAAFADLAYSIQVGRLPFDCRLAIVPAGAAPFIQQA